MASWAIMAPFPGIPPSIPNGKGNGNGLLRSSGVPPPAENGEFIGADLGMTSGRVGSSGDGVLWSGYRVLVPGLGVWGGVWAA